MAVSYVLVTVAAVVVVEGVVLGILLPRILASSSRASQEVTVAERAGTTAKFLSALAIDIRAHRPKTLTGQQLVRLLAENPELRGIDLFASPSKTPGADQKCLATTNIQALIWVDGTVLASSRPGLCSPGARLAFAVRRGIAARGTASGGSILWEVTPVVASPVSKGNSTPTPGPSPSVSPVAGPAVPTGTAGSPPAGKGNEGDLASPGTGLVRPGDVIGEVYAGAPAPSGGISLAQLRPLLLAGGVALALVIPVGTLFGLLSTRRVIRRIKRLAEVTGTVAGGDFSRGCRCRAATRSAGSRTRSTG